MVAAGKLRGGEIILVVEEDCDRFPDPAINIVFDPFTSLSIETLKGVTCTW